MWRHCREMTLPDDLAYRLRQFREWGRLVSPGPELFANASWLAVLIGQDGLPRRHDPLVDQRPGVDARGRLSSIATLIGEAAEAMPRHEQWLARLAAS